MFVRTDLRAPNSPARAGRAAMMLVASLLLGSPADSGAAWRQLDASNITVIGDGNERTLRVAAARVAAFRAALMQLERGARAGSEPLIVLVCESARVFNAILPRFNGRPLKDVGGFFQQGSETSFIGLGRGGSTEENLRVVFHELAHAVLSTSEDRPPPWWNEGLAEYYSTFEWLADGRGGRVGTPVRHHLETLHAQFMPLAELLAIDYESPFYNEGARRSLFYAQSWALVHYLLDERGVRREAFDDYSARLARGEARVDAFARSFAQSVDQVERELRSYVQRPALAGRIVALSTPGDGGPSVKPQLITDARLDTVIADLLLLQGRAEEARARVEPLARALPVSSRTHEPAVVAEARRIIGQLELREGRVAEAVAELRAAAREATDTFSAHLFLARALLQDARRAARSDPRLLEACRAAERATEVRPESDAAWAWLARCQLRRVSGAASALLAARRAIDAAPRVPDHRLLLARALLELRDLPAAREALDAATLLKAGADSPERLDVERAAHALELEAQARTALAAGRPHEEDVRRLTDALASLNALASRAASDQRATNSTDVAPWTTSALVGALRPVGARETRLFGLLGRIECVRDGVRVHVLLAGHGTAVLTARLEQVLVYSYRDDVRGELACGTGEVGKGALITWAPPPEITGRDGAPIEQGVPIPLGRLVSLEFTPPGFLPD